jgi:hypothetical protein
MVYIFSNQSPNSGLVLRVSERKMLVYLLSFGHHFATRVKVFRNHRINFYQCYDFLKYFRRKILRKNWRFLLKTKLNYAKF